MGLYGFYGSSFTANSFRRSTRQRLSHNGCNRVSALTPTALPYPVGDYIVAYRGSSSTPIHCADWDDCAVCGTSNQQFDAAVKTFLPKEDVCSSLVVLPADTGHAVLFGVFHEGVMVFHILCYTVYEARVPLYVVAATELYQIGAHASPFFLRCPIGIVVLCTVPLLCFCTR